MPIEHILTGSNGGKGDDGDDGENFDSRAEGGRNAVCGWFSDERAGNGVNGRKGHAGENGRNGTPGSPARNLVLTVASFHGGLIFQANGGAGGDAGLFNAKDPDS